MAVKSSLNSHSAEVFYPFGSATLALALLVFADLSPGGAWAQDRRGSGQPSRTSPPAEALVRPPVRTIPEIETASAFGGALASCDKDQEDIQLALPGLKGEIKLDGCYRGRHQLVCRFDAIMAEGKSLSEEFTRIVEERYPEVSNVDGICKINFESLVKDAAGASQFNKRFAAARAEYDAGTGCANKVKHSLQDLTFPELSHAPAVLKSIIDAFGQEISRVSIVQEQVSGLAAKVEASQKSIAVLQKLHRAMCLESKAGAKTDQSAAVFSSTVGPLFDGVARLTREEAIKAFGAVAVPEKILSVTTYSAFPCFTSMCPQFGQSKECSPGRPAFVTNSLMAVPHLGHAGHPIAEQCGVADW